MEASPKLIKQLAQANQAETGSREIRGNYIQRSEWHRTRKV